MESIGRAVKFGATTLSNAAAASRFTLYLRGRARRSNYIENQSSGVIPVMKMLEDAFLKAMPTNGARGGRRFISMRTTRIFCVFWLNGKMLTKNRIKTLSLGSGDPGYYLPAGERKRANGALFAL